MCSCRVLQFFVCTGHDLAKLLPTCVSFLNFKKLAKFCRMLVCVMRYNITVGECFVDSIFQRAYSAMKQGLDDFIVKRCCGSAL